MKPFLKTLLWTVSVIILVYNHNTTLGQNTKKIVLEEFTGAWCGNCPFASIYAEELKEKYGDKVIIYAHHFYDSLEIPDAIYMGQFTNGFPSGMVDRTKFPGKESQGLGIHEWEKYIDAKISEIPSVGISLENLQFDTNSRLMTIDLNGEFYKEIAGELRPNIYLVEDSVTGDGEGYDQVNYFNEDSVPDNPFFGMGDPIKSYRHRHVLRAALGGMWGTEGKLPQNGVNSGYSFSHQYSYTLPAHWNPKRVSIIGLVQKVKWIDIESREMEIYNATEISLLPKDIPIKDTIIKDTIIKDTIIKDTIIKDTIIKDTIIKDTIIKDTIIKDTTTSVHELSAGNETVQIYPNPVHSNQLEVQLSPTFSGNGSINISNTIGERLILFPDISFSSTDCKSMKIDISSLQRGVFILTVDDGQHRVSTKFVKE